MAKTSLDVLETCSITARRSPRLLRKIRQVIATFQLAKANGSIVQSTTPFKLEPYGGASCRLILVNTRVCSVSEDTIRLEAPAVVWTRMVYLAPDADGACRHSTSSSTVAARALMVQEVWSTEGCALEGRALEGRALMQASRSRRQAKEVSSRQSREKRRSCSSQGTRCGFFRDVNSFSDFTCVL